MACAANFCRNHLKKTRRSEETRHIRYHYFPKDEQRKRQWIRFCDRGGDWYPLSKSTMCSVHFTEDSYERNLQAELLNIKAVKKLKLTAVPTLIDENDVQIVDERKVRVKKRENKRLVQELLDESASTQVDNLTSELQTVQGKEANMMQFGKKTNKVQDSKKNKSCRKGSFKGSRENLVLPDASYSGDTGGNNNCGDSCTDLCKSYLILEPTVILSTDTNAGCHCVPNCLELTVDSTMANDTQTFSLSHNKGRTVIGRERKRVYNVYQFFKKLSSPLYRKSLNFNEPVTLCALALGISEEAVIRINQETCSSQPSSTNKTKRKIIVEREREVVYNVYTFLKKLSSSSFRETLNFNQAGKLCGLACGFSERTVNKINREAKSYIDQDSEPIFSTPGKERKRKFQVTGLNDLEKDVLRGIVSSYRERGAFPTSRELTKELKEKINYTGSETSTRRLLKRMGYYDESDCSFDIKDSKATSQSATDETGSSDDSESIFGLNATWVKENHCGQNMCESSVWDHSIIVFQFPSDEPRRGQWVEAVGRGDWTPTMSSRVCVKHFSEDHLISVERFISKDGKMCEFRSAKPKLSAEAVPTLLLNMPGGRLRYKSKGEKKEGLEKREAGKKEGDPDKKPRKKKIKESNDDEVPRPETSTVRNKLRKRKLNCCAMGCQNTSDSCLMFIIPKDPTLRNRWVLNINRKGWQPNDQSAVCEMHFVSDWWEQDPLGGRSLKPDAVPTEYLTGDAWASGPSTASASGSGHEWTDNNWTETEGDEEMMDIEEHSVFIKQELMEPEVDLKEELDPEAPTEPVPGFETVFVNSTEFKDGDKSDFPPIKVEVEETEENESSDNETEPKVPRYSTVPSYLGSSSPVITSTSVLSCSSAPTVSVVTTFPSSVTTTTVSTVTGLMSTLPSPLMVPVIPNVTQKTAPGGVPAGHKQFIILCPQTVQKTLTTQSSTSSTQTTVAPLTSKQLQEMPKLIKPHGSHKVIGLTPVQASKIISATPIQSSQVRSPTPIQLPQAKNLIPIKLPPAKSLTPAQSSQAKSPTPTQLPQAKSPTPTQLPQPKSLTTTQSCQAESPPSQPTSSPPTQEAPPPSNQTNQEPQLVDNCYVETENSIKIDLSALPQALKAGIKEKVKYLLDAIFLKHINPKDIVIAFRQSKGAQFAILSA